MLASSLDPRRDRRGVAHARSRAARQIARRGPPPVFATISGAHLYGFASPDSDVDLRGAFLLPAADLLGLRPPSETIAIEDATTIDLDWVAHDLRKIARLMTNHNGYVLEQLYSPLVVITTRTTRSCASSAAAASRGRRCATTRASPADGGGAWRARPDREAPPLRVPGPCHRDPPAQTGEVVANMTALNQRFAWPRIGRPQARRRGGDGARRRRAGAHEAVLDRLEAALDAPRAATCPRSRPPWRLSTTWWCALASGVTVFALAPHTIFLTLAGSQAHGTARDGSDVDLRGVCIAPLALRLSLFGGFEQAEGPLDRSSRPCPARARPTVAGRRPSASSSTWPSWWPVRGGEPERARAPLRRRRTGSSRPAWRRLHAARQPS